MPVIDAHTHHYPPEALADPAGWGQERGETHWVELVTQGPQGWASAETFLASMDEADVDLAVLLGWYWEEIATCREQNAFLAGRVKKYPGRFASFASVQPSAGAAANLALLNEANDLGLCGIGEVHPTAQGFSLRDEAWLEICRWAQDNGWPINLHVTEPAGHDYTGRVETPLMDYVWLAEQFPEVSFIFAHWGGGLPFFALNPRVRKALRNCFVDTAASPLVYSKEIWKHVVDLYGHERILFGTDYPLRLYPRKEKLPAILSLKRELDEQVLDSTAHTAILGENMAKLLPAFRL
tara:strand:+ start:219452 stop:220336 length:885 start_codon:yes stop_codon:yes gene_type:complete